MPNISEAQKTYDPQEPSQPQQREAVRIRALAAENAHDARNIAEKTVLAATRTEGAVVGATNEMIQKQADQGREAVREGLGVTAGVMASLVDASSDQTRRVMETTTRVTDVYRDAARRSTDDMQALVGAYSNIGRGLRQYQQTYLDLFNRSMETMARKQMDLFRAKSPVAFAETQRDIYLEGVTILLTGSTTLLEFAGRITQEIVQPLRERARARADVGTA